MKFKLMLLLGILLNTVSGLNAQIEYHVSPNGQKNGNGTFESPFNSIEAAKQKVVKVNKNIVITSYSIHYTKLYDSITDGTMVMPQLLEVTMC